jgi:hypothetical protein
VKVRLKEYLGKGRLRVLSHLSRESIVASSPPDLYAGRHLEVIQKREETESMTLEMRKCYNRSRAIRE